MSSPETVPAGWSGIPGHPRFRAAVESNASAVLDQYDRRDPILRWLTKNLGRSSTLARILILGARQGEVSVADILDLVRRRGTLSESSALRLAARARQAGLLRITPPNGPWDRRKVAPEPALLRLFSERAAAEIEAASLLAPAIRPALALVGGEGFLLAFMAALGRFDPMAAQLRGPASPGMRLFLVHDAGLMMLYDLMLSQPPGRERLLDAANLSRARLARRFDVSRTHVTRLFAEAEAGDHLAFLAHDHVAFSAAMDEEAARHFAVTFHTVRLAALDALARMTGTGAAEA